MIRAKIIVALWVLVLSVRLLGNRPNDRSRDRFDYTAAISDSWKTQMLFNMVRIRYGDAPVFLECHLGDRPVPGGRADHLAATANNSPWSSSQTLGAMGQYVDRPTSRTLLSWEINLPGA